MAFSGFRGSLALSSFMWLLYRFSRVFCSREMSQSVFVVPPKYVGPACLVLPSYFLLVPIGPPFFSTVYLLSSTGEALFIPPLFFISTVFLDLTLRPLNGHSNHHPKFSPSFTLCHPPDVGRLGVSEVVQSLSSHPLAADPSSPARGRILPATTLNRIVSDRLIPPPPIIQVPHFFLET